MLPVLLLAIKIVSRNSRQMMDVSQSENSHLGEQKAIKNRVFAVVHSCESKE